MSTAERFVGAYPTNATVTETIDDIMDEDEIGRREAKWKLIDRLSKNPGELLKWWKGLANEWVTYSDDHGGRFRQAVPNTKTRAKMPPNWGKKHLGEEFAEAKDRILASLNSEQPVGNTGVRKRRGSLTEDDAMTIADYHESLAHSNRLVAEMWRRIAATMKEQNRRKLETTDLPDDLAQFIANDCRVREAA